ncbi:MAG: TonB-dependent receptor plug domain-containing protein [Bacteroidales bacterium]|nr:TonB-dependent receptor plug domain-containing protein [Bacteroidales bacterium]
MKKAIRIFFLINIILMISTSLLAQTDTIERQLDTIHVIAQKNKNNFETIKITDIKNSVSTDGNYIEQIVKMQPGVSSVSELSSQYNVRGGSFDENLVYINGIEIYRPLFIRSGEQEGLTFVNSELTSKADFSAGGFGAEYGDKLSSVLDISYRKPTKFALSSSIGLLGASLSIENKSKNDKFTWLTGFRYKTSKYLLNTLEKKGEYNPIDADWQIFSTYKISPKISCWFLGILSSNKFSFIPQSQSTSFGTLENALKMNIYYSGREDDIYQSGLSAIAFEYSNRENIKLTISGSTYSSAEKISCDIAADYLLNNLNQQFGNENNTDSTMNIGVGETLHHIRNRLNSNITNIKHDGLYYYQNNKLGWGINSTFYNVKSYVDEWQTMDSAGYFINNNQTLAMYHLLKQNNKFIATEISGYIYNKIDFNILNTKLSANVGVRANYSDFSDITTLSPRLSIFLDPKFKNQYTFKISIGRYVQPLTFRELLNSDGTKLLNSNPQKSLQFVFGVYHDFRMWNRPFKITAEAYHKKLNDIIPYTVDNVKIKYYLSQRSNGYSQGIDFKIYGEFVKGLDSWLSLSLLKTEEDIKDDYYIDKETQTPINPGYIPRPDDRRFVSSLNFKDFFPGFDFLGMNLALVYATPLPFGPENTPKYMAIYRTKSYLRTDFGLEAKLFKNKLKEDKSINISLDIFNLFDIKNTVSYSWITVVPSSTESDYVQYAIPDRLTSRRINIKISIKI